MSFSGFGRRRLGALLAYGSMTAVLADAATTALLAEGYRTVVLASQTLTTPDSYLTIVEVTLTDYTIGYSLWQCIHSETSCVIDAPIVLGWGRVP